MLRNTTRATIHLSGSVDGRVVDDDGTPLSGVAVQVTDDSGFVVTRVETGDDGEFTVGPVEENETYRLRATVDGVPYRRTASAAENGTTIVARPPITDASRLSVANDSQSPYVLQVVPPGNESSVPSVIETVTLRNPTDRPFVGPVELPVPTDATPYAGMVAGEEAEYRRTDAGVELNVSVPANGVTRVGVAYDLTGPVVETAPRRATGSLTVVVQGYDPTAIDHSENLRVGDAPIPMLTSDGPVDAGERIRLDFDGARTRGTPRAPVPAPAPGRGTPPRESPRRRPPRTAARPRTTPSRRSPACRSSVPSAAWWSSDSWAIDCTRGTETAERAPVGARTATWSSSRSAASRFRRGSAFGVGSVTTSSLARSYSRSSTPKISPTSRVIRRVVRSASASSSAAASPPSGVGASSTVGVGDAGGVGSVSDPPAAVESLVDVASGPSSPPIASARMSSGAGVGVGSVVPSGGVGSAVGSGVGSGSGSGSAVPSASAASLVSAVSASPASVSRTVARLVSMRATRSSNRSRSSLVSPRPRSPCPRRRRWLA
ncbi:carboxypeptidase regulatory-like domain-containing protein [Haloplanus litoreus]|uniref:carboxypeptidase regulatory-like domain-containing protein n=1 Tax=Haloplanus litoreus TaxID=767515 RepID=UPI00361DC4B0